MRCRKCNVDLAETYTLCPLCGEKASDDAPLLEGFTVAPYPKNSPVKPMEKVKKPKETKAVKKPTNEDTEELVTEITEEDIEIYETDDT